MFVQSKYTKIFVSNSLTETKYNELHDFAMRLNEHKNKISKHICDNLLKYLETKTFQFVTEMRIAYNCDVPSCFDKQLYQ